MISVNSLFDNFKSLSDNKKDALLYRDSCFDENENRFVLEATKTCIKFMKIPWIPSWIMIQL